MDNPFSNNKIPFQEDEPKIEGSGSQILEEESTKETKKVVDEEKKDESSPVEEKDNTVILQEGYVKKTRAELILEKYNGVETAIPVNSRYWKYKR